MNKNIKLALILTPAIFLIAIWILALSSSVLLTSMGLVKLIFWATLLSFGSALSITLFIQEVIAK